MVEQKERSRVKKIILTHSFKGGTGKTVIATNFAYYFNKKGYKVLYIDGDLLAPSLDKIFPPTKDKNEIKTWTDYLEGIYDNLTDVIYSTSYENLDIIYSPPPEVGKSFLAEKTSSWWVRALKRSLTIREIWNNNEIDYDFIVLDNQNGINMNSANNITLSDIGFLVLRPVHYGMSGTVHLLREMYATLQDFREREDYLIWNQIPRADDAKNAYIDKLLLDWDNFFQEGGLEPIARINYDVELAISMLAMRENKLLGISDNVQNEIDQICKKIHLGQ
ncbi:MAG: ParA family protein [Candidatus Hodarchaeales archaeon]|jgi:MinD-like ATPase involved in chromosome partitioning or flagellar assembly